MIFLYYVIFERPSKGEQYFYYIFLWDINKWFENIKKIKLKIVKLWKYKKVNFLKKKQ